LESHSQEGKTVSRNDRFKGARPALGVLASLALFLASGCNGGPEAHWDLPADYGSRVNPEGHIIILVIDRSLSMTQKDPDNFNIAGAQIALSVMDDEDNAGVVTFAGEGNLLQPTRALESAQGRVEFRDKLESIDITGRRTDFAKGLGAAKALLEPLKGRTRKAVSVIFLTDGEHSVRETEGDISPLIDEFEKNNWKIYSIDLAAKTAKTDLLRDMAQRTRGAYFKIENPEDLPRAFIEIFSDIKDFWRQGRRGDVLVEPLMKKLMYLLIRSREGGHFRGIYIDGKITPQETENLYHYPDLASGEARRRYWFEIASFSRPVPGTYSYQTAKKPKVWTLATFPVSLTLMPDAPKKLYKEDDPVEFGIQASCESEEVAAMVRKAAFVSVRLSSEANEEKTLKVVLSPVTQDEVGDPLSLVFRGSIFIQLSEKGVPEDFTARIRFAIRDEQGGQWFAGKLATFRVEPGRPKVLMLDPPQVLIGNRWVDGGVLTAALASNTEVGGPVQVTAEAQGKGLAVEPASVTLNMGDPVSFSVTVDPASKMPPGGEFQEAILFKASSSDGRTVEIKVPVIFGVYAFEGPETVKPPAVPPGYQISHSFEVKVAPALAQAEFLCDKVSGPGGEVPVMIRFDDVTPGRNGENGSASGTDGKESSGDEDGEEDSGEGDEIIPEEGKPEDGEGEGTGEPGEEGEGEDAEAAPEEPVAPPEPSVYRIRIDVPTKKSLAEGVYKGIITLTGPGEPPLTREIPLELEMTIPTPEVKLEPEKITIDPQEEGWTEIDVQVTLTSAFPCSLQMLAEDLLMQSEDGSRGVISKAFDIRLVPQEGWGGDLVEFDKPYRFRYRIYVSPNLLPGAYTGGVVLDLSGQNKSAKIRLPVELVLK